MLLKKRRVRWIAIGLLLATSIVKSDAPMLQDGDHVAIIGDSITEKFGYSIYIEDYLIACQPAKNLSVTQFGYGGEHAKGALTRLETEIFPFNPTVATTCYGMNDGNYAELTPEVESIYRKSQTELTSRLKSKGMKVLMATPGCVDIDNYTIRNNAGAEKYNKTLGQLAVIVKEIAKEQDTRFADVHTPMMTGMNLAKQKNGARFSFAGTDGIHPSKSGHIVMAYAILKALGCSGDIGTITLDLNSGASQATDGHTITSFNDGKVELISTRYPFCFSGQPQEANSTSAALDLVPFNQDLNRLILKVDGIKSDRAKITWGKGSKIFSASALQAGINLADEFIQNPFSDAFSKVDSAVNLKQRNDFKIIKLFLHNLQQFEEVVPNERANLMRLRDEFIRAGTASRRQVASTVVPVKHTIVIEPVNE